MDHINVKLTPSQLALALELSIDHHKKMRSLRDRSPDMIAGSRAIAAHFDDATKLSTLLMQAVERARCDAATGPGMESSPIPFTDPPTAGLGADSQPKKPPRRRGGRTTR